MRTICVFCGSADRVHPDYLVAARQMGAAISQRGMRLLYGAGGTGLMGAVADGSLDVGGEVYGIIPTLFNTPVLVHNGLTHLEIVENMHTRKQRMFELSDAFIALPGGYGTFEEFFEMLTWAQIGLHTKPMGLLNTRNYYTPMIRLIEQAQAEGFIYDIHRTLFCIGDTPEELLGALMDYQPPQGLQRWLKRD